MTQKSDKERSRSRIQKSVHGNLARVNFGGLVILDHAEVVNLSALFRKLPTASHVVIDLDGVMSLPSGFFGMLLDGVEMGLRVEIKNSLPAIEALIGFQMFVTGGVVHLWPNCDMACE